MNNRILLLLLGLLISFNCVGQTPIDTILHNAKTLVEAGKNQETLAMLDTTDMPTAHLTSNQKVLFYKTRGHALLNLWQLSQAETTFRNALKPYQLNKLPKDSNYVQTLLMLGNTQSSARQNEAAIQSLKEGLEVGEQLLPEGHGLIPAFYNSLGIINKDKNNFDKALYYYEKALELFTKKYKTENHKNVAAVCSNLGNLYREIFNLKKAVLYCKKAYEISIRVSGEEDYGSVTYALNLADFYSIIGDQQSAIPLKKSALNNAKKILPPEHPQIAILQDALASSYTSIGAYQEAEKLFASASDIYKINKEKDLVAFYFHYMYMGSLYYKEGRSEKELETYLKAKSILTDLKEAAPPGLIGDNLAVLGRCYLLDGSYEKAIQHLKAAIEISTEVYGANQPETMEKICNLANAYRKQKSYDQAQKILQTVIDRGREKHDMKPIFDRQYLIDAHSDLSEIFYQKYLQNDERDFLIQAIEQHNLALELIQELRLHNNNALATLKLNKNYASVFEQGLQIHYAAYQDDPSKENASLFLSQLEISKSFNLLEDILSNDAYHFSGIPDDFISDEQELKSNLAYLQNLYEKENDQTTKDSLSTLIIQQRLKLTDIQQTIKNSYPDYYSYFYELPKPSIDNIQDKISNQQAIIEYFIGASTVYAIKISKKEIGIYQLEKDFPLEEWGDSLIQSIQYPFIVNQSLEAYKQSKKQYELMGFQLYQKLIAPLGSLPTQLTIIPDDVLWSIPFDCLLMEESTGDFINKPYMVKRHQIDYQFSILLQDILAKKEVSAKGWVGFAPNFSEGSIAQVRSNLQPLKYNIQEVKMISDITHGDLFTEMKAVKRNFISNLDKYAIFHFATHASISSEINQPPYLAFTPDSTDWALRLHDIYNLEVPAEMVVLSACGSGYGKIEKGEGMASLGRAFFYAGTKSVIMTQWQVNDRVTAGLMESFYLNLQEGKNKSEALNRVKRNYITQQNEGQMAHPFYWAGFTPVGNMDVIQFSNNKKIVFWVLGGLLILGLGFFFRKSKSPE